MLGQQQHANPRNGVLNDHIVAMLVWKQVLETQDLCLTAEVPWYDPLDTGKLSLSSFRTSAIGRFITRNMVWGLEKVGIVPKGSCEVSSFLETGADALVEGGK
jgi:sterol 24-C-methyltransferase